MKGKITLIIDGKTIANKEYTSRSDRREAIKRWGWLFCLDTQKLISKVEIGIDPVEFGDNPIVLTEQQVLEIQQKYKPFTHGAGRCALAREYGVSESAIETAIRHREFTTPVRKHRISTRFKTEYKTERKKQISSLAPLTQNGKK